MTTIAQDTPTGKATLPPGPRPMPYIGNLLSLRSDPLGYMQQLQRRYGNMATIHMGRTPLVVLFRPEYVRYALIEHPRTFSNEGMGPQRNDESVANEGLLTIDGEQHRQQRRAVQPAFHKKQVEGYASTIEQYTQELLQSWHTGDILDMSSAMQALTLRIVSKCLFSLDLSNQLSALGDNFNAMLGNSTSTAEDLLNIHIDNTVTGYGKRLAATRQLDRIIYTLIAQRRENNHEQNDMLSMLITAPSGATPETNLTDKQIRDHMLTFLAAGHETTAISLTWTFYLLSKYPQVREKLQDELRSVLAGRTPTMDDLTKLPYLEWVLNESMRLYPPAWMQARFVVQDFELDGVHIPAGTMIMLSQWVIHRLPEFWDEPETFRPERWDPDHSETITPGAYFPFGGGPRMCIGMPFAQLEAKMVLALILQRYTPQAVPGYNPGLKPTITLRPKHNLRTTLLPADLNSTSAQWKQLISVPEATLTSNEERNGCLGAMLRLFGLL